MDVFLGFTGFGLMWFFIMLPFVLGDIWKGK